MPLDFDPLSAPVTVYIVINWLMLLVTLFTLLFVYARHRYLFAKPSMLIIGMAHILFQWPLAILAGYYESWLPKPYDLVLLVHGVILVSLTGSALTFRTATQNVWRKITVSDSPDSSFRHSAIVILLILTAIMTVLYLLYVPPACTGLYVLLTNPRWAPLAREYSLKLVADPIPRYTLSFIASAVVPLLTAFVAVEIMKAKQKFTATNVIFVVGLTLAWGAAFLSAANSIIAGLIMVIILVVLWSRGLAIALWRLPLLAVAVLAPAFAIFYVYSLLSSGQLRAGDPNYQYSQCSERIGQTISSAQGDSLKDALVIAQAPKAPPSKSSPSRTDESRVSQLISMGAAQAGAILNRAFVIPFQVGVWYVHYAQTKGPIGIDALPRIARIFGRGPISAPNLIGGAYAPEYYGRPVQSTIWASAGFPLTYYGYFGLLAVLLVPFLIWLSDIAILIYRYLPRAFGLPLAAALSLSIIKFLESDYTAVWLTHGFGVMLLIAVALAIVTGLRKRTSSADHVESP